ncbi:DUF2523 domain-containing protein [Psychrobacter sp. NG254]|jgi:hypothetical protein|uniref:DUF2523 family protein n=1 Tax=Psychrobacter sp. NG254 TaxID=2782003 RepID=UPI00188947FD|nr:DUF2523 family protein [Psychrobacter sp. NG254]MBF2720645.1 DUF2523 domain-containing protein [Psychrobacter sp. NG254]MBF2720654.1 DUF2523 domain-containing protein [Psychrobacter sp. NG254]
MWKIIAGAITSTFGGLGKRVLLGMGLGLASGAIVFAVINYYVNKIVVSAGALGDMAAILHLAGMDAAVSIVIGAVIVRATIGATKISLSRAAK